MIRFGSVCSGIEAASVALGPLGWEAAWLSEVDMGASAVLAHHYRATAPVYPLNAASEKAARKIQFGERITNYGDMTRLPALVRAGKVEAPDALVGGTPCQSFSLAGLRFGLSDDRGQLTLAFCDLADAIDEVRTNRGERPAVIMWENVPGVLNHKDNPFGCFLAALAGEDVPLVPPGARWTDSGVVVGPQRTVAWRTGNAEFFGLAQRRNRVYVVASAIEGFDPGTVLLEFDGVRRDSPPRREAGEEVTHPVAPCLTSSGRGVERTGDPRGQDPVVACIRRPGRSAELNSPSAPVPTWWDGRDVSQTLDAVLYKGQTMPEKNRFPAVLQPTAYGRNNTSGPIHTAAAVNAHGGPHGRLDFESETFVLEAIGFSCKDYGADASAEVAPTMRASGGGGDKAYCVTGEVTHTLKADGFDGSEDGTGRGQPIVNYNMAVRRLLPVECEALQGFPPNYTLVPVGKKMAADGPRYKQLGNSWAVNHVRWIGRRITAEYERVVALESRPSNVLDLYFQALALTA